MKPVIFSTQACGKFTGILRLATFMSAVPELIYPFPQAPEPGAWSEPLLGLRWLRMPLPFALDHVNLWLIRDGAGWALVDTGYALPEIKQFWEQILARLEGPLTRIIATHFHPDHLGLAHWLQEKTGAPLVCTAGEYLTAHAAWQEMAGHGPRPMLAQFHAHGLAATGLKALAERGNAYRRGVEGLPETYERIRDGDSLCLGNQDWRVICGYGHSPEHASLYCAEQGVLISGDMLLPKISTNISVFAVNPTADALDQYLTSLKHLEALVPGSVLVLPSHGLPFRGLQARVGALEAHHEARLRLLEENCEVARSAGDLLSTLFPRALDTHQTMFAMGEAIAHLNHLEKAGRLRRSVDADGKILYLRAVPAN